MIRTLRQLKNGIPLSVVRQKSSSSYNQPQSGNDMPRAGGIGTFMRLPYYATAKGLDVGILGIPFDCGTSYRSGARFGPRQIRSESSLLRPCNASTGDEPFQNLQVGDLGDVPVTIYNIFEAIKDIRTFLSNVLKENCTPLTMGGDHSITYPILQAMKDKYGPVGLVHVDAHADVNDTMMNCKIAHGTSFRRAVEEGLLDSKRVVQIGLRGTSYTPTDFQWSVDQGFRLILAEECWHCSLNPVMDDIRKQMGNAPVYVSMDIDALDPAFAPGTEIFFSKTYTDSHSMAKENETGYSLRLELNVILSETLQFYQLRQMVLEELAALEDKFNKEMEEKKNGKSNVNIKNEERGAAGPSSTEPREGSQRKSRKGEYCNFRFPLAKEKVTSEGTKKASRCQRFRRWLSSRCAKLCCGCNSQPD